MKPGAAERSATAVEPFLPFFIIGAVVGYWLGEGPRMGRLAANGHAKKNGGSPIEAD